jgi:hypothetical protein
MPLSLYVYWKYGRPTKPTNAGEGHEMKHHEMSSRDVSAPPTDKETDAEQGQESGHQVGRMNLRGGQGDILADGEVKNHNQMPPGHREGQPKTSNETNQQQMHSMHDMHGPLPDRPIWATVTVGVMHCGAGCVLGDLVGEWLVYGTGATINGADIWPCLLVDYAFALLFGIAFQYFSIAPMSGEYGLKTVWRAAKADIASLTAFEVGLFGWMVIYQVAIWEYRLAMDTWVYWWMMQVGMVLGFVTAFPVNWFLLTRKIKEPCG